MNPCFLRLLRVHLVGWDNSVTPLKPTLHKGSRIKELAAALALGLCKVFLKTPFGILGIGSIGFSIVRGLEVSPINLPFSEASVS